VPAPCRELEAKPIEALICWRMMMGGIEGSLVVMKPLEKRQYPKEEDAPSELIPGKLTSSEDRSAVWSRIAISSA
jgi:hypothetical protein